MEAVQSNWPISCTGSQTWRVGSLSHHSLSSQGIAEKFLITQNNYTLRVNHKFIMDRTSGNLIQALSNIAVVLVLPIVKFYSKVKFLESPWKSVNWKLFIDTELFFFYRAIGKYSLKKIELKFLRCGGNLWGLGKNITFGFDEL
jgi:hypothetical protein